MSSLTMGQKRALLIVGGIVFLLLSYFLVFQRNMESASKMETEIDKMQAEIERLTGLQMEIDSMRTDASSQQELTQDYTRSFPCDLPQESAIYNVYKLMTKSGIEVSSISPGVAKRFLIDGKFVPFDGRTTEVISVSDTTEEGQVHSDVENEPSSLASLNEMVGKTVDYQLSVTGSLKEIMKAVDWVQNNNDMEEPMSVTSLNFSYDNTTGQLSGTMTIFFHSLNGNGIQYENPVDVDDFNIGTDNLFGVLKRKK